MPLPTYAPMLAAYQRPHEADLRKMIADLPLTAGARVLDLACGAGVYTCWLAERVGREGMVVDLDIDPAFLAEAAAAVSAADLAERVTLQRGDRALLPFDDPDCFVTYVDLLACGVKRPGSAPGNSLR